MHVALFGGLHATGADLRAALLPAHTSTSSPCTAHTPPPRPSQRDALLPDGALFLQLDLDKSNRDTPAPVYLRARTVLLCSRSNLLTSKNKMQKQSIHCYLVFCFPSFFRCLLNPHCVPVAFFSLSKYLPLSFQSISLL